MKKRVILLLYTLAVINANCEEHAQFDESLRLAKRSLKTNYSDFAAADRSLYLKGPTSVNGPLYPEEPIGPTDPNGPLYPKGAIGATGVNGSPYSNDCVGPTGVNGPLSPKGLTGVNGSPDQKSSVRNKARHYYPKDKYSKKCKNKSPQGYRCFNGYHRNKKIV